MKHLFSFFLCTIFISSIGFSQNTCSKYYPFNEGSSFQITSFDKKGKKQSVVDYSISNVTSNKATFNTTIYDAKGKEVSTSNYDVTCKDDIISIDFSSLISPELFAQYKDMEMDVTGTNIEIPNNLSVGQTLNDADMLMTINVGGMNMKMNMKLLNRKVESKETITTSAGTFDCYVITYTNEFKMGIKQIFMARDYLAEGVGVVKTESFSKNGKLKGYSLLTQISN